MNYVKTDCFFTRVERRCHHRGRGAVTDCWQSGHASCPQLALARSSVTAVIRDRFDLKSLTLPLERSAANSWLSDQRLVHNVMFLLRYLYRMHKTNLPVESRERFHSTLYRNFFDAVVRFSQLSATRLGGKFVMKSLDVPPHLNYTTLWNTWHHFEYQWPMA